MKFSFLRHSALVLASIMILSLFCACKKEPTENMGSASNTVQGNTTSSLTNTNSIFESDSTQPGQTTDIPNNSQTESSTQPQTPSTSENSGNTGNPSDTAGKGDTPTETPEENPLPSVEWILTPSVSEDYASFAGNTHFLVGPDWHTRTSLYDFTGNLILKADDIEAYNSALTSVERMIVYKNNQYALTDLSGRIVFDYQDHPITTYGGDTILLKKEVGGDNKEYWIIDKNGNIIGDFGEIPGGWGYAPDEWTFTCYDTSSKKLYELTLTEGSESNEVIGVKELSSATDSPIVPVVSNLQYNITTGEYSYQNLGYGIFEDGKLQTTKVFESLTLISSTPSPANRLYFGQLKGETYTVVSRTGETVFRNQFEAFSDIEDFGILVKENGKWGIMKVPRKL